MHTAVNPGIQYDETKQKAHDRYQGAVKRAGFLNDKERENWAVLGSLLNTRQLKQAEMLIIDEDLRRLATRESLERIKPNQKS